MLTPQEIQLMFRILWNGEGSFTEFTTRLKALPEYIQVALRDITRGLVNQDVGQVQRAITRGLAHQNRDAITRFILRPSAFVAGGVLHVGRFTLALDAFMLAREFDTELERLERLQGVEAFQREQINAGIVGTRDAAEDWQYLAVSNQTGGFTVERVTRVRNRGSVDQQAAGNNIAMPPVWARDP
jgi:hypothetical protein